MASISVSKTVKRRDDRQRRIASKKLSKLEASQKDEARSAAENVAELFTRGWKGSNFCVPEILASSYDVASVASSRASKHEVVGVENAVRRGLQKGLSERNERNHNSDSIAAFRDDMSDFDLTIVTEDVHTSISGDLQLQKKRAGAKKKAGNKKKMNSLECISKELAHDAWMCGVCGKAFSSLPSAEKHEDQHIREVVLRLGWGGDKFHFFSSNESVHSYPRSNNRRNATDDPSDPIRQMHAAPAGIDPLFGFEDQDDSLLLSNTMKQAIVLADEALVTVCSKAEQLILTEAEIEAERELEWLAKDKAYYDHVAERTLTRRRNPASRFRSEGKSAFSKMQNKFVDAYQLMKEGDPQSMTSDQYNRKRGGQDDTDIMIEHSDATLYVNVMVKNSIQVVSHELERLAKRRWLEESQVGGNRFERFRAIAHGNLVKLAGLALASDFTPRRIAVQLSNDLYRLLKPKMKRRGVTIETEIEYRVGPYFVLAVNIQSIDWGKLIKATQKDVTIRESRWKAQKRRKAIEEGTSSEGDEQEKSMFQRRCDSLRHFSRMTRFDMIAHVLAMLYHCHWTIFLPICCFYYYTFLGPTIRSFIISSVTDDIFYYVEEKGMEMEIEVRKAKKQAAFMLAALRELRADDRALKKKQQDADSADKGTILGPLLGPAIKADKDSPVIPPGFQMPDNLEDVGLELDLPVGFRRLRWALLSSESEFLKEAVNRQECGYDDITFGSWSKHDEHIGAADLPPTVDPSDFVGAEKETSYLMPKSAFVSANMCYEKKTITMYNDYIFCCKNVTSTPDVPYGKTFLAWTQLVVINTGNNTCRLICSVEAEFPNGPPMVSRQIKSGMRAGTGEVFVKLGETITKYADEYP